jgi:hypothetical protein
VQAVDITGNWTVETTTSTFGVQVAEPRATIPRRAAIDTGQSRDDYSDPVMLLGRLKPGTARESQRVVHTFVLVRDFLHDVVVTARCGVRLTASDLQWLPGMTGMPCEQCVMIR